MNCPSCGKDWTDHLGMIGTCAELQRVKSDNERYQAALVRLRDCDWIITPRNRMDAVREIARKALSPQSY